MSAIGIIGTGWVGSSVAISALHMGVAQELLLCDARPGLAEGEAMDLAHGASFYPACHVRSATVSEMHQTDALVISAGRGGTANQTRLELLRDNAAVVCELARELKNYAGVVILVSNPVDVLTYFFQKVSALPPQRVIGTGTMLDTARLRQILGRELDLDPRSIHAQVVGEHGDSEVVLWSTARAGGRLLRRWPDWSSEREARITLEVRGAAYEIIRRKGATNHAIGLVTASLLKSLLRNERRVLTVSRMQSDAIGLEDVALSLPCIVDSSGATRLLEPELDSLEQEALVRSAQILREAIVSLGPIS